MPTPRSRGPGRGKRRSITTVRYSRESSEHCLKRLRWHKRRSAKCTSPRKEVRIKLGTVQDQDLAGVESAKHPCDRSAAQALDILQGGH